MGCNFGWNSDSRKAPLRTGHLRLKRLKSQAGVKKAGKSVSERRACGKHDTKRLEQLKKIKIT